MLNSKLTNQIHLIPNNTETVINKAKKGVKENNDILNVSFKEGIDYFDLVVLDGIVTLYFFNNNTFTIDMLFRTLNGYKDKQKASLNARALIEQSINKLCNFNVTIFSQNSHEQIEGSILDVEKIEIGDKNKYDAYFLKKEPILYDYCKRINHIIAVDMDFVNSKGCVQFSRLNTLIKMYLLKRIAIMKKNSNNNQKNKIVFSNILDLCSPITKNMKINIKKNCMKYLLRLKKLNYINDYSYNRKSIEIVK